MKKKHEHLRTILFLEDMVPGEARVIIESQLKKSIETGDLAIGTRITQQSVADIFNVSRMPVREAFLKLDAQGYLVHVPNRGYIVAKNTQRTPIPADLNNLLAPIKKLYQQIDDQLQREFFERELIRLVRNN